MAQNDGTKKQKWVSWLDTTQKVGNKKTAIKFSFDLHLTEYKQQKFSMFLLSSSDSRWWW